MKRTNIFLLSYVIFIFLCLAVKSCWDYPMWNTIVAAITVASWMFAYADLLKIQSLGLKRIAQEQLEYSDYVAFEIEKLKGANSKRLQTSNSQKDESHRWIKTTNEALSELENNCNNMSKYTKKNLRGSSIMYCVSLLLTIIGFIMFFSVIVFQPITEWVITNQDHMTVVAFGLILLSQFLEGALDDARTFFVEENGKVKEGMVALRKSYESECMNNIDD